MSKITNNIYTLYNNPFIFTSLIIEFYKNHKSQSNDLLLSYLILPLVLYEDSKIWLKFAKKNSSSIFTFCNERNKPYKNNNLYGLPERIINYKNMTNLCLQYAIDNKYIKINDDLRIIVTQEKEIYCPKFLDDSRLAASKIHIIFDDQSVSSIYIHLGIKKL